MADSIKKFDELLLEIKKNQDHTPQGSLSAFVHFLKGMKLLIQNASFSEREDLFMKFQKEQKEFEKVMQDLKLENDQMKDPAKVEKIRKQIESNEFKDLIKKMSEELFSIVKIMTENQG